MNPWPPNVTGRYEACARHRGALSRMDFDRAFEIAEACTVCITESRPATSSGDHTK